MRSYKAARREHTGEPVQFKIDYTDDWGDEQQEVFTCVGEVSSLVISEMAHNATVDTATPEGAALLRQFFAAALGDEAQYQRLFRLVLTQNIDDETLMDIMAGLVEDFAGRPTKQPSGSRPTPSTTGDDSKVVSLPGGFTAAAEPVARELEQGEQDQEPRRSWSPEMTPGRPEEPRASSG